MFFKWMESNLDLFFRKIQRRTKTRELTVFSNLSANQRITTKNSKIIA